MNFISVQLKFIDIIGMLERPLPACVYSTEEPKKSRIKFKLTDGRYLDIEWKCATMYYLIPYNDYIKNW